MDATATAPAPQHMRALAQANRVRLARAELKRQVAEGEVDVTEIVLACPWEAESMTIADLLMSQHRWGRTRCRRFLASIPMLETKTVGSMAERHPNALAGQLSGEPAAARFGGLPFVGTWARSGAGESPRWGGGPRARKPGPPVASSTTWPSGSRR